MKRISENRTSGFTLVELMIVVAIIGVLASVAIPSFNNYQLNSKRAEAYANLSAIATAQKAYFAEFNEFLTVAPEPFTTSGIIATATKQDSASISPAFSNLGWAPDGDVYFSYDSITPADTLVAGVCNCAAACFTSTAYGDLDGDGLVSIVIYAHPDAAGDTCSTGLAGHSGPWFAPGNQVDEVTRVLAADEF